jgi:hypothetical protein
MEHLKANMGGMCLEWSFTKSFFSVDQKSKIVTIAGHRIIWENEKNHFSQKLKI